MANMSYCRFENTYSDFGDCLIALQWEGIDSLSESEQKYALKLYKYAKQFVLIYESQNEDAKGREADVDIDMSGEWVEIPES